MESFINSERVCFKPLTLDYSFKPFDCGNKDLNEFLFNDSKKYLKHLCYTTFILETDERIIAYYSLANDLLDTSRDIEDFTEELADSRNKIEYDFWETFICQGAYPAAKIGRLAVDKSFQSKGIGTMIMNALVHSFTRNNKTGCQFITVDALNKNDQKAIRFYEKCGFKFLTVYDVNKPSRQMYKSLLEYII